MRSLGDRIRHTILFEIIALAIVASFGSWIIGRSVVDVGILGIMFSVMVMGWNFLFNWMFDLWDDEETVAAAEKVRFSKSPADIAFEVMEPLSLPFRSIPERKLELEFLWYYGGKAEHLSKMSTQN